ncbi:MAG: hypothetical protein WC755_02370 [Candidatus Woesearchaeota archaeon]|jgi:hypothetical protein
MVAESIEIKINTFLICSVRNATPEEIAFYSFYKQFMNMRGYNIHYPKEDTNQTDNIGGGYYIIKQNGLAMKNANQIHVFWTNSEGSKSDVQLSIMEQIKSHTPILIINPEYVKGIAKKELEIASKEQKTTKSYTQSLLYASRQFKKDKTRKIIDEAVKAYIVLSDLPKLTFKEGYNSIK